MSEGLGAEEEVEGEEGSDEDQFEEAANQIDDGAAAQAAQPGSGLALGVDVNVRGGSKLITLVI